MSMETLLVVLAVALAAVVNVILPLLKKSQDDGQAGNAEPEVPEAQPAVMASSLAAMPAPEFEAQRNAPTAATWAVEAAAVRPARRSSLRCRSGMRNGIVLAAVLGPCRAQTPFV